MSSNGRRAKRGRDTPRAPDEVSLGSDTRTRAEADQTLSELDQTNSDGDQTASDADQGASWADEAASEADQRSADADQQSADRDQAAADRDKASAPDDSSSQGSFETSREERAVAASERETTAATRAETAVARTREALARDDTAKVRDLIASARDRAADARDMAAEQHGESLQTQAGSEAQAGQASKTIRVLQQSRAAIRALAAADRARAAADRQKAADDRERASNDRRQARIDLQRAHLDYLTGVYTRAMGQLTLQHELDRAHRSDEPFVLAFIDVDNLKETNDREGHAAGDALLQAVVLAIKAKLRSYDPIVRVGGDEFLCGFPNTRLAAATHRLEEIQDALEHSEPTGSITVGLAALNPDDSLEDLTARADANLYQKTALLRPEHWAGLRINSTSSGLTRIPRTVTSHVPLISRSPYSSGCAAGTGRIRAVATPTRPAGARPCNTGPVLPPPLSGGALTLAR